MTSLGQLKTKEPIEKAMREIRDWLSKLGVNGLSINTNYDPRQNVALLSFKYKDKSYEFRSTKQSNCRLNMWGIAKIMEYKVRSQIMGIEDFSKSMVAYLQLENKSGSENLSPEQVNESNYIKLGISPLASNEEIKKAWLNLMKTFHPDMALSEGAKNEFTKRVSEINEAYTQIKKERKLENEETHD
jgi:DnaJ-domain-containing protein 1